MPQPDLPVPASRLSALQRLFLMLGALLFGSLGVVAIFTTDNEAGTAVALLLCGILLLVAVQGTKVQRITAGDNSIELSEIRRSVAVQAINEASDNPDAADEILQVFESADPQSTSDPAIASARALIFEKQVLRAVEEALDGQQPEPTAPDGYDAGYRMFGRSLYIEAKYRMPHRKLWLSDIRKLVASLDRDRADGLLIVSNVGMTSDARRFLRASAAPVRVVVWEADAPTSEIRSAIAELVGSSAPE